MNIIVFGASKGGQLFYDYITQKEEAVTIVAFTDNNPKAIGGSINSIPVITPKEIVNQTFDKIYIAVGVHRYIAEILKQLKDMGISEDKIEIADRLINGYSEDSHPRVIWLRDFARHVYANGITGNVAECGVHKGHFAYFINKYFYDKRLYLFDTFEGFPRQDVDIELSRKDDSFNNSVYATDETIFTLSDPEIVMKTMPHPENCIVKRGYFPDTAVDVKDKFCFVNLDMDLYKPMLDGLHFFWDKMSAGGIILLHDYYHPELPGVAHAVADFEASVKRQICKTTIGDFSSIALIKGGE